MCRAREKERFCDWKIYDFIMNFGGKIMHGRIHKFETRGIDNVISGGRWFGGVVVFVSSRHLWGKNDQNMEIEVQRSLDCSSRLSVLG